MNIGMPDVHYGDCTWPDSALAAHPARWSETEAIEALRSYLASHHGVPTESEACVVEWVRRDLPDLRGDRDRTTPDALYRRIATVALGESLFAAGRAGADQMGYGVLLDGVDEWAVSRFVGLGCPWIPGLPEQGDRVLDLGCGSGVDLAVAGAAVGASGLAIGVDRLPHLAAVSARRPGTPVVLAQAQACPTRSAWADLVVANGLPPLLGMRSAASVIAEIWRVLRVGGGLRFITLVVGRDVTTEELGDEEVLDAVRCAKPTCAQYRSLLARIGFRNVQVTALPSPFVAGYRSGAVRSVLVTAQKVGEL